MNKERTPSQLLEDVCKVFEVTTQQIKDKNKSQEIARTRNYYSYFCKFHYGFHSVIIPHLINRDRTSINNQTRRVTKLIKEKDYDTLFNIGKIKKGLGL